jgi:large subunit ribosomal protein L2
VERIEYHPTRSADIAFLNYTDREKGNILAPRGVGIGSQVVSLMFRRRIFPSDVLAVPPDTSGSFVHCLEMEPGRGAAIAGGAEIDAQIVAFADGYLTTKMLNGEVHLLNPKCRAMIGQIGNSNHGQQSLRKDGGNRWRGRLPRTGDVIMNPMGHSMGSREGQISKVVIWCRRVTICSGLSHASAFGEVESLDLSEKK